MKVEQGMARLNGDAVRGTRVKFNEYLSFFVVSEMPEGMDCYYASVLPDKSCPCCDRPLLDNGSQGAFAMTKQTFVAMLDALRAEAEKIP